MSGTLKGGILTVDDNPSNLHLMTGVLREGGYTVRAAPNGEMALEAVAARPPDLILLDVRMPDIDGFEVCRRLKADPATRDIPVIFLSALRESSDKLTGFEAGAVDYITKPFVAEEVLVRVQSHLALREMQLALSHKVKERTRALRTLSAGNQAVVHADSVEGLMQEMARAITVAGRYHAVWIGLGDNTDYVLGRDGDDPRLESCARVAAGLPEAPGPYLLTDPGHLWADWQACGVASALVLPLEGDGDDQGRIVVFDPAADTFDDPEDIELLAELAGDLRFGIETLRTRQAQERSLEQTIEAIAATIEVRDPYTAGHQRRTTAIARAIGEELGLDADRLRGLHVAGSIHDIGKISIPVELLSRPGKLAPAEFALIKGHPESGHDIISGIDFPWPVAAIVRQHHERLDGSGYPDGLSGDAILQESRILAVADVVEAIASHRPYRPALGLEAAMAELREQRGTLYDPEVVDACLRLAEEQRLPGFDEAE